ncbi:hypothetical protein [Cohaesibacter gelatinilyticus]|uniref:Transmembrane protein (PGPGW) n=1 Tax=Cohaesibacter gelatinilyticus TaxID=372072 RepID=A0A285NDH6_9HYPH|nr:hypothetical protein [Cohaesibacter gelatinilyticus]SNZ07542.1 hypothetical protein SAMN06265368_1073 [Cohaesibacter gelatinilyticus]
MITPRKSISLGQWTIAMPGTPKARRSLGIILIIGGVLGFLPVLGFWMIPLGLFVLSVDSPYLRRLRRKGQALLERKSRSDKVIMAYQTGDWSQVNEADRMDFQKQG